MVYHTTHAPKGQFLFLNEEQNAAFDTEYHSPEEYESKFSILAEVTKKRPFSVLDLGGGNGLFCDQLLARFPKSTVTILDVSALLLAKNMPSERKELIHGSIECMDTTLAGRTFDYITANWVFHHLVGNSYQSSRDNCLKALMQCKRLLKPNGMLIVAENMFDGHLRSNLPSHFIYAITAIKWRWFIRLANRFFNTAGVGVCFQSQRSWQQIFAEAGFAIVTYKRGVVWLRSGRSLRGMATQLLFLKSVSHGHFFLKPSN
jgi:ubiquinone/menaquinone biosynthesis C-methylase UbiE